MRAMFTFAAGAGAPAVVFVHGFACDHTDWIAQIDALAAHHSVLACDLRGHGRTPGEPADCSIETCGADVAALVAERIGAPAVLVGHSMGCRVVLEACRRAPERVAGLVLVDASRLGSGDPGEAAEAMRAAIDFVGFPAFAEALFKQMFLGPSAEAARIVERAKRLSPSVGVALFASMVRWDAARMDEALGAVRVPLMVIQSTTMGPDRKRVALRAGETTPWLDLVRSRAPHARIETLVGLGHFPQLEAPARVNALLANFLGTLA
jgi:pimeloyl-ACP methyl ester carboxylesterase